MTMKNHFQAFVLSVTLVAAAVLFAAFAAKAETPLNDKQFAAAASTFRGERAVERLKAAGEYDSLAEAVHRARQGKSGVFSSSRQSSAFSTMTAKLIAVDGANGDRFGESISISGDTVVIGAFLDDVGDNLNQGTAYVFVRNASGGWTQQAKLNAGDGVEDDRFGSDVAIRGDTIVVGAMGDDVNNNINQGSAYVFTRSGSDWTQRAKLTVPNLSIVNFGISVAISDGTIIVGTLEEVKGEINQGSAYVFTGSGSAWTEQAKLLALDGKVFDRFGWSVAISGETAVIGAYLNNVGSSNDQGAAYIFTRNGNLWTQQAKLTASDGAQFEEFGWSVAISGDTVIVGAKEAAIGEYFSQGSAYVFVRNGNNWTQQAKLFAPDGFPFDHFGWSVSVSGNAAAVGSVFGGTNGVLDEGAVYTFVRNGSQWRLLRKLIAPDAAQLDGFGTSVTISGDKLYIGAADSVIGDNIDQGSAYIYTLRTQNPAFDFDGDGKADVSVFRPGDGNWYRIDSGSNQFSAVRFGLGTDRLAPADYDGDGKTDVAVFRDGNWYILQSSDSQFRAVQFGAGGDMPRPADFDGDGRADVSVFRPANGTWYRVNSSGGQFIASQFGASGDVPLIGDFDGDGKADLAVFRPLDGTWYALRSADNSLSAVRFGTQEDIPAAADFDGDGKTDLSVFRAAQGTWYRINSSDNQFVAAQFGSAEDKPVAADYDGDGRADIAVFRPGAGAWYILRSASGFTGLQFGTNTDVPVPFVFSQ